ncbi:MAG: HNH endonuclease [Dehalogenimonas sp.]|uniref:HNH endonuclease n=1 Tax=Candidatus Dehalogenimonas loeffleri TaxID=3127115 RepID=A0ABZ2J980_9CHLR|nr:HNH endonuclease [Dehalogenimonas sp.]
MIEVNYGFSKEIGQCIYCGSTEELTDEHIIPFSLGGRFILRNASCLTCNRITNSFETKILRDGGQFDLIRSVGKLPSREKILRPKEHDFAIEGNKVKVPVEKCPGLFMMPIFRPPRYIVNYDSSVSCVLGATLHISKGSEELLAGLGNKVEGELKNVTRLFPRLLAKIAYGMVISERGLDALETNFVLPCILGKQDDAREWVGCERTSVLPKDSLFHNLACYEKDGVIGVTIRLFANFQTPEYLVIVGKLKCTGS